MKIQMKITFSWSIVFIWMVVIFTFSNMNTTESNGKSQTIVSDVMEQTLDTTNKFGITDKHPSEEKKETVVEKLNKPFRKMSHASEYCILTLLLLNALYVSGVKGKKKYIIAIMCCFLYACTDEYHQTFVDGRTGQFSDTLIDTSGGVIAVCLVYIFKRVKENLKSKTKEKVISK